MREFWICDHGNWYHSKELALEEQSESALIHVRTVSPAYDAAVAKMYQALEFYALPRNTFTWPGDATPAREAMVIFEKAKAGK